LGAPPGDDVIPPEESTQTAEAALSSSAATFQHGPHVTSVHYASVGAPIPAGIAAGETVFFVGSPLEGRVTAYSRATGQPIGDLPQPPGHLVLPLIIHSIGTTRIAVLDCGGFPSPGTIDAEPSIYEYEYSYSGGTFSASLARTVSFAGTRIGFAEEFVYLGSGEYLVPDAVYGALYRVAADGTIHSGIAPKSFDTADAIPSMVYCNTMPQVTVGGLPFLFTDSTIPGIAGIAVRSGTIYFYSSCSAGLYRFPYASLFDNRQPWERARDIKLIASKPAGVEVEELLEMQFNPYDSTDPYLYVADALQLRLIRINPKNGKRQVLGDDPHLFNFPASLGFVPPEKNGCATGPQLLVLSNQQHRDPLLNGAISSDLTQIPYVVTKVSVGH
jgi:hypothetical protein